MTTLRVSSALRDLLKEQIACRTDPNEGTPGITVYAKLGSGLAVVDLTDIETNELREELEFFLMPDVERTVGETNCARAALRQIKAALNTRTLSAMQESLKVGGPCS